MRLKTFALSAPTAERPAPHTISARFSRQTRCVTALYERRFPKFMASRGWKVLVECVPAVTDPRIVDRLGVLTVQREFDVPGFLSAEPERKKRLALEGLWAGIVEVARREGWPLEPFEEARRAVLEQDFVNTWPWPKRPAIEASTKRRAQLHCDHGVDAFRAAIVVTDRAGHELLRAAAFEEIPSEFCFVPKLGALTWEGPDTVVLTGRDDRVVAEVRVPRSATIP